MKLKTLASLAAALSIISSAAIASSSPAIVTTADFGVGGLATNTIGFEFTALTAFAIDGLGVYDSGQNGLFESHVAGLWDAGGALLTVSVIPGGTVAPLLGLYRYVSIAPINLVAGRNYFVGVYNADDRDPSYCCQWPVFTDPRLSLIEFGVGNSLSFRAPDFIVPPNNYANFTLRAAVPEPASWAMLIAGLGLTGAALRRRREAVRVSC